MNKSGILKQYLQTRDKMQTPPSKDEGAHVWLKAFQATMSLLSFGTVALPALTL